MAEKRELRPAYRFDPVEQIQARRNAAEAENTRLREALDNILVYEAGRGLDKSEYSYMIAQRALSTNTED